MENKVRKKCVVASNDMRIGVLSKLFILEACLKFPKGVVDSVPPKPSSKLTENINA